MDKDEILKKSQESKDIVGEMERKAINKSAMISLLVLGILAVAAIIVEGILGHFTSIYVIAALCLIWAGVFYFLQYFLAKRPVGVLIGGILEILTAVYFIVRYILAVTGVWW